MSNEILQKVKDDYAKENGYRNSVGYHKYKDWEEFFDKIYTDGKPSKLDVHIDEIAERHADAVTLELKAENEQMKSDIKELRNFIQKSAFEPCQADTEEAINILEKTAHYE